MFLTLIYRNGDKDAKCVALWEKDPKLSTQLVLEKVQG